MNLIKYNFFLVFIILCGFILINCSKQDAVKIAKKPLLSSAFPSRSDNPPNMLHIVKQVANSYPEVLKDSCRAGQENHVFTGLVIEELRKTSPRWGFNCKRGNCDSLSIDAITYYRGEDDPNQSSDVAIFDIIGNCHSDNPRPGWTDLTDETREAGSIGRFLYPHPDPNLLSDFSLDDNDISDFAWSKIRWLHHNVSGWAETSRISSMEIRSNGQICIHHSQASHWPGKRIGDGDLAGNPWIIVKIDGQYYAATYEWLRPGQICKFGHAPKTDSLSKVYSSENSIGRHTKKSPLREWVPEGGDIVGFMVSGLARDNNRNVSERSNIVWYRMPSIDGSISGGQVGTSDSSSPTSTSTTTTVIEGQCGRQPHTCTSGDFHNHPGDDETHYRWTCRNRPHVLHNGKIEQRCRESKSSGNMISCSEEDLAKGFMVKNRKCLPPCGYFHTNNATGVEMAKDAECRDIQNYNISIVTKETHDAAVCCRRSSKRICPSPHYSLRTYKGESNCFPSCGHAAHLAGWGHYGSDNKKGTQDDPHHFFSTSSVCDSLNALGHNDWQNLSHFYDLYRFEQLSHQEVAEVLIMREGGCCVRGDKTTKSSQPYPFSRTVTTTTTTTTTNECQVASDCVGGGLMECQGGQCIDITP